MLNLPHVLLQCNANINKKISIESSIMEVVSIFSKYIVVFEYKPDFQNCTK